MTRRNARALVAPLVLCLLVGTLLNIGIAWVIGAFAGPDMTGGYNLPGRGWPLKPPDGWPEPDDWSRHEAFGFTSLGAWHNLDELARTRRQDPNVVVHAMIVDQFGFPMRAVQGRRLLVQRGRTIQSIDVGVLAGGLAAPQWSNPNRYAFRRIAFDPIWNGLVGNSILYGAAAFALGRSARALRGHLRARRGHCPACGYSLHDLPPGVRCPECGAPITPRGEVRGTGRD